MMKLLASTLISATFSGMLVMAAQAAGDAPAPKDASEMTDIEKAEKKCKDTKGKVWDKKAQKCADAQQGSLDDESIYETGRYLATNGRYDEAITILNFVANPDDKRVLNYLGYAYRKSGQIDVGLKYYQASLAIDPDYVLVREYMGEALIQKGDIQGAKAQLAEIEARCGVTCEPYVDLAAELAKVAKG
ncbi:MAG: tetratricopeptide repeat protein [Rhizobiaceae bacterium]